jgi:hypothetical protein
MTALMKEAVRSSAVLVPNYQSTGTTSYPTRLHSSAVGIITLFSHILLIACEVAGLFKDLKKEKMLA